MKIVIAPDSFKGSASSSEIGRWIASGIHSVIPNCETVTIAIGDGGEGSLDSVLQSGFTAIECEVLGPVDNPVRAKFGLRDKTALIEMAQASGLAQLPEGRKSALSASSYGTGQLMKAALDNHATEIILAIGGSATTDAGAGALQALGARLRDASGNEIARGGAALSNCAEIDISNLDPRLAGVNFIVASDVTNSLLGDNGAARVFAPQKGATPEDVETLEKSLAHFASLIGADFADLPGAGAAGGFGYMAMALLNAQQRSGIDLILDLVNFDAQCAGADYIVTGEGRFDSQSLQGKAPWGILQRAQSRSIPTYLICGDADTHQSGDFAAVLTLTSLEPDREKCIENPEPLVTHLGAKLAEELIN